MRPGITFDAGALIAATARRANVQRVLRFAQEDALIITVPVVVIAEWWREESREARKLLRGLSVELLTTPIAQLAGEAIRVIPTATTIDAIVMASAAQRGDVVYTSDPHDLEALRGHFRAVPAIFRI